MSSAPVLSCRTISRMSLCFGVSDSARRKSGRRSSLRMRRYSSKLCAVLEMDAAEMRKRRNPDTDHIAAMPERVGVNKATRLFLRRDDVGSRDFGSRAHETVRKRNRAIGALSVQSAIGDSIPFSICPRDDGVVGQLHLIDRDRIRLKLDCAAHCVMPLLFRFTHHAGDQIDVDLGKVDFARPLVSAINLRRQDGPARLQRGCSSLKCSTPRLSRVTPIALSVSSFDFCNVPGSHSNVTSSAFSQLT